MKKPESHEEYIREFPVEVRLALEEVRAAIRRAAPAATETISYGMPAFRQQRILAYFAAWKRHIGFYPASSEAIAAFADDLAGYECSKGAIRFPLDRPMPTALIERIVRYRVEHQE